MCAAITVCACVGQIVVISLPAYFFFPFLQQKAINQTDSALFLFCFSTTSLFFLNLFLPHLLFAALLQSRVASLSSSSLLSPLPTTASSFPSRVFQFLFSVLPLYFLLSSPIISTPSFISLPHSPSPSFSFLVCQSVDTNPLEAVLGSAIFAGPPTSPTPAIPTTVCPGVLCAVWAKH